MFLLSFWTYPKLFEHTTPIVQTCPSTSNHEPNLLCTGTSHCSLSTFKHRSTTTEHVWACQNTSEHTWRTDPNMFEHRLSDVCVWLNIVHDDVEVCSDNIQLCLDIFERCLDMYVWGLDISKCLWIMFLLCSDIDVQVFMLKWCSDDVRTCLNNVWMSLNDVRTTFRCVRTRPIIIQSWSNMSEHHSSQPNMFAYHSAEPNMTEHVWTSSENTFEQYSKRVWNTFIHALACSDVFVCPWTVIERA